MLRKLLDVVRAKAAGDEGPLPEAIASLLSTAPAEVRELATVLATRRVRVSLGWRGIESRYLRRLADTWRQVADDSGATDPREAELANGVQIGASAGGEVCFGLCWSARGVYVAEIDFEDGLIRWFDTLEAFFDMVKSSEGKRGGALPEALVAILPAAAPAPVVPAPAVGVYAGTPPAHPFAVAQAHFAQQQQVHAAGPTPQGRTLLVRRFTAGSPYTPTAIVVREPDGSVRPVSWPDTKDIYGVCLVPGHERALVCGGGGTPGPIFDIDLESGAMVERVANAGWSCGFVDDQHFVTHEEKQARVYVYAGGVAPVAATPIAGFNMFVGHGRVFVVPNSELTSFVWTGGTLVSELAPTPLVPRVNFMSAAVVHDGRRLLCSVDWKGNATWFDYGPA